MLFNVLQFRYNNNLKYMWLLPLFMIVIFLVTASSLFFGMIFAGIVTVFSSTTGRDKDDLFKGMLILGTSVSVLIEAVFLLNLS